MKLSDKEISFLRTDAENLEGYIQYGCVIYLENDCNDVLN